MSCQMNYLFSAVYQPEGRTITNPSLQVLKSSDHTELSGKGFLKESIFANVLRSKESLFDGSLRFFKEPLVESLVVGVDLVLLQYYHVPMGVAWSRNLVLLCGQRKLLIIKLQNKHPKHVLLDSHQERMSVQPAGLLLGSWRCSTWLVWSFRCLSSPLNPSLMYHQEAELQV